MLTTTTGVDTYMVPDINPEEDDYEQRLLSRAVQLRPEIRVAARNDKGERVRLIFVEPEIVNHFPLSAMRIKLVEEGNEGNVWWSDYNIWGDDGAGPFADPQFVVPLLYQELIDTFEAAGALLPRPGRLSDDV